MTASSFPIPSHESSQAGIGQLGVDLRVRLFFSSVERKRQLASRAICNRSILVYAVTAGMGHFHSPLISGARKSGFTKSSRLNLFRAATRIVRPNDCNRSARFSFIKHLQQPPRIGGVVNGVSPFVGSILHASNHEARNVGNVRKVVGVIQNVEC